MKLDTPIVLTEMRWILINEGKIAIIAYTLIRMFLRSSNQLEL